ncbi:MAG: HEAT repeat domain-containing protein [Planctomycetota bacterium]
MNQSNTVTHLVALLVVACTCALVTEPVQAWSTTLGIAQVAPTTRPIDTSNPFAVKLEELLPGMGAEKIVDREAAQQEFEQLCLQAGRPGADQERLLICQAMLARLGPETAQPARVWMLRQLERISGAESVERIVELLDDTDPRIRELSRRVLQNNSSPMATMALSLALRRGGDTAWQVALINALAARGDPAGMNLVVPLTGSDDEAVALAAIAALGDFAGAPVTAQLRQIWIGEREVLRQPAGAALIRACENQLAAGQGEAAAKLFREVFDGSENVPELRVAALRGLVACQQEKAVALLIGLIGADNDPPMQIMAARLVQDIPGDQVTYALMADFERWGHTPDIQALLLDVLAQRGNPKAKLVVFSALQLGDTEVRIAAVRALEKLGDASDILLLAGIVADVQGPEREAAREVLARLPGEDVDAHILTTLGMPEDDGARAALALSVADRHNTAGVPTLFAAAVDTSAAVRQAAFESLGKLADTDRLPMLVDLLIGESDDEARQAVEDAVVNVGLKLTNQDERAAPVLARLDGTAGAARVALIRVLGRIQGSAALVAIRAAVRDTDEQVVDAAVRALADWREPVVLEDLLSIAGGDGSQVHQVLALRGYVRLLRVPEQRPTSETLALLQGAMKLAERPEEQRLVLGALGELPEPEALHMALAYLDDPELKNEAAVAAVAVARALAVEDNDAARAALDKVVATDVADHARQQAREALELFDRFQGYSAAWLYAGPCSQEGKGAKEIIDVVFPAETGSAEVAWQPLTVNKLDNPWIYDLTRIDQASNCCMYVRTSIWSDQARPARLEIGSDDGVKAWLNGSEVHRNPASRGINPAEDKIDIELEKGWNTLLLKIVQGGGGWGFTCGVRARDGQPLPELKFKAE